MVVVVERMGRFMEIDEVCVGAHSLAEAVDRRPNRLGVHTVVRELRRRSSAVVESLKAFLYSRDSRTDRRLNASVFISTRRPGRFGIAL